MKGLARRIATVNKIFLLRHPFVSYRGNTENKKIEIVDRFSWEACQMKGLAPGMKNGEQQQTAYLIRFLIFSKKFNQQRLEPLDVIC